MPEPPSGTVTILFTDIEGSTSLLQHLGDLGYREVLDAHDRLLQSAFAEHGGQIVETQGDAFLVAFRSARDAMPGSPHKGRSSSSRGPATPRCVSEWDCTPGSR